MMRDQCGIEVRDFAGPATVTATGLPRGYRITCDRYGLALWRGRDLVRTSATREALVSYAWEREGARR